MIWFINIHVQVYLEMHRNNYRHRNRFGGLAAFLLLIFGIVVFLGFFTGYLRFIYWPFSTIGTILVFLLVAAIVSSARRRARYRRAQHHQNRKYKAYRPTENPFWKNQEKEVVQEQEQFQRTVRAVQFCDYCGMKVNEEMKFCINCGNQLK